MRSAVRALVCALSLSLVASCAQEIVAHQQNERQANRILVLLDRSGISGTKLRDEESRNLAFHLLVDKSEKSSALEVLEQYNLPEVPRDDTGAMFKDSGMIPTNVQERAKREVGVTGDIVNSLRKIPRVVDASALVSIPEDNPLRDVNEAKPKPKAAVLLTYLPDGENRPPVSVADVQRFVQAALPELQMAEVSVQMIPAGALSMTGTTEPGPSGPSEPGAVVAPTVINGCEPASVAGIAVCAEDKQNLVYGMVLFAVVAFLLSVMATLSILRALRYRKDLTRLTAQVQQHRP